ncbi:MAG: BolA family transcriptional regulator [Rhodoferax sp.]|jgi:BolA protein|nr:BolA family transcriptional regulator [Rhodoferax sp.]MBP9685221.1 BolA family transcriptional regulator [Rhodoferax sp.]
MTANTTTAPTAQQLDQRLRETLQPTLLEVLDESYQHNGHAGANGTGFGTHFRVRITSPLFTGKSPVARHRLVYDALQDFMAQGLHALAIEAQTPPL